MKKAYQKPVLFAETFTLSDHIASNCRIDKENHIQADYLNKESCKFYDGSNVLYMSNAIGAICEGMDMGMFSNVDDYLASLECYNGFTTADTTFVS